MGTKNKPGEFDCLQNAEPDEPFFVLLGRDPMAPLLVRVWVVLRELVGENPDKLAEAVRCAEDLEAWARKLGKGDNIKEVGKNFAGTVEQLAPLLVKASKR